MKLILREPVDHLGDRGDIVSVAPGYARNYLLPKGLAWTATPGNLKTVQHQRRVWATKEIQEVSEAQARAAEIGKLELTVSHRAGSSGTLYGSVTKAQIVELLAAKGILVDRRRLGLDDPIKSIGTFPISIKLHGKVSATFKLVVEPEGGLPLPVDETPEPPARAARGHRDGDDRDGDDRDEDGDGAAE